jgi:hypothetical protein
MRLTSIVRNCARTEGGGQARPTNPQEGRYEDWGPFLGFDKKECPKRVQRDKGDSAVGSGQFLDRFKALGWFLDELVLTAVNALPKAQRMTKCLAARASLAERIRAYQPLATVSVMRGIGTS